MPCDNRSLAEDNDDVREQTYHHRHRCESHGRLIVPAFEDLRGVGGGTELVVMSEADAADDIKAS